MVGLKEWSALFRPPDAPVRTPRQYRLLNDYDVDLINVFKNVKRHVRDVPTRDFIWNFCNGVAYYDRKIKCPCGVTRKMDHIAFSCKRNLVWVDRLSLLPGRPPDFPDSWSLESILLTLQRSANNFTVGVISATLKTTWECMDAPFISKEVWLRNVERVMRAEWFYALNHPDHKNIPRSLLTSFYTYWSYITRMNIADVPVLELGPLKDLMP